MVLIGLIFSACGGGGGGDSTQTPTEVDEIKTGYFKDSAVSGLDYSSCNEAKTVCIEKMTGVDGDFEYREGDTARFKLGDLVIAEGPAKPLLIPADVSQDEESSKKLGQLLMTLDEDNDPLTGIKIPYAVNQNAKDIVFEPDADFYALTQDDVKLQELVNGVNGEEKTLVSEVEVEEHLELSARLRLMREFSDPIKHYLGDKYYKEDSKFNVDILNISPKRRLLLGIWNEKKMALLSESKKFSDQTTADEKKRAELMYAISVAKGIADSAIMIVDLKKVDLGDLGVTGIQIVGTVASLEMNGNALSSGVDIGVESDVFKGVLGGVVGGLENSNGGFNGFVRGGAKDLIGAGLGYSGAPDVFKGALEAGWPMVDTIWENMDTHGMKIGLQNLKNLDFDTLNNLDINQLSLIADGIEKSLQIAVNLSAANQVTDSRNMELTVMAAIEYLEAFYKSAGDAQYMSDEYDLPIRIDAAYKLLNNRLVADGSWWDYVFRDDGDVIIDKTLFLEYVSSSLSAISLSTKTYIQQLSPSVTDAEAILTPLPQKVCNGVTFELRATTDKGFEQDPNDLSNILWQTPSEVTSEVS
ncbi:MAG: hypothetical protein U9O86_04060, partial [Campylobacterota bacterium]|nr:hypothetical protein [Campylobacterota bacterium]